jgi:hypothetical protein
MSSQKIPCKKFGLRSDGAKEFQKAFDDAQKIKTTNLPQIADRLEKQLFDTRIKDKGSPSLFSKAKNFFIESTIFSGCVGSCVYRN